VTNPGIEALKATALEAALGGARTFGRGRDLAWQGLVPRQTTKGGRPKLLSISKWNSKDLRKMLI